MSMIKLRFAPSPTGFLHLGGLRTALYNFLFARKHNGSFVLRIEDTDQSRIVKDSKADILSKLTLFGLSFDSVITQSMRLNLYKDASEYLVDGDHAYPCFCSQSRLQSLRRQQLSKGIGTGYDRLCHNIPKHIAKKRTKDEPYSVRLKMPSGKISFLDLVYGPLEFNSDLNDPVILKQDGFPTYHLANVVDDLNTDITHVMRGEEWINSTPKHLVLHEALSKYYKKQIPQFAHLPLLMNSKGHKISKRDLNMSTLDTLLEKYEPEAILNFIAFLGWQPPKENANEILSLENLVGLFDLKDINTSRPKVLLQKLDFFQKYHFKDKLSGQTAELTQLLKSKYPNNNYSTHQLGRIILACGAGVSEKAGLLQDAHPFFSDNFILKFSNDDHDTFSKQVLDYWNTNFDISFKDYPNKGKLSKFVRYGLTGRTTGPPISLYMELLGKDECIRRIQRLN